jgi:type VI secretion system protein ImpK
MAPDDPQPDPFAAFEGERTIIKPSAGRGARPATPPSAPMHPAPAAAPGWAPPPAPAPASSAGPGGVDPSPALPPELPPYASLNPLVQAAAPLLSAAPRLRAMLQHANPALLRAQLVESVQRFESAARAQGLPNDQVVAARYVLCTLIDESAASTPWGGSGAWAAQSLLVHFHNEAWGGEKVFQLLARLAENPQQHRPLLELVYCALALGFEGRYKVQADGRAQLDSIRQRLAAKLRELAGPAPRELSPQWQGAAAAPQRLADGIPLWAIGALLALVLLALFVVLRLTLNAQTDATFTALQAIAVPAPPPPAAPATPPPPRLAQLLQPDIAAGLLQVEDLADRSVVILRGDGLFAAGSADVVASAQPLFGRIAAALAQLPGPVMVSGHSDSVPIRTLRYPSNWHLSKDRANSVKEVLAQTLPAARLSAEGRADTEPVADNATAEGRARNRRVEISLGMGG